MKRIIAMSFFLVFDVSCGDSEAPSENNVTFDLVGFEFYNEFIPCVGGSDFNQENVDKMMKGWRSLNISDDLLTSIFLVSISGRTFSLRLKVAIPR